ncbi:MAG: hypothetical protein DCC49_05060 [Acidobacteria bacterium]|nr:MAG: hypothetical protein DCC49_05060 [Acidobacteriota bacterium]
MSDLPSGWAWTTLGDVSRKPQYGWTSKSNPESAGLPYLRTTDITKGPIDWGQVPKCVETPADLHRFLLQPGDIVVSRAGSVGVSALIQRPPPAIFASYLIRLQVIAPMSAAYVAHFLQSSGYWRQVSDAKVGIAVQNVSAKKLAAIALPVPPLAEQERIVAAIEEHFSHLDAADASLRSAETRLGLVTSRAVDVAFLSLDKRVPVGEIADVRGGIQKQPKRKPKDNAAPFLRVANVGHGRMDLRDVHEIELFDGELERCRLQAGDLLVVEGNGSPDQIGRSAVWQGEIDDCVHQNHLIRVRPGPQLDPEFLGLYWNAPSTRAQLTAVASSTSGLHTLSTAKVKRIEVPAAPIDRQKAIVAHLTVQIAAFARLRASLRLATERQSNLRHAILAAAFSGKLVPQDPDDEPASVLLDRIREERAAATPKKRARSAAAT